MEYPNTAVGRVRAWLDITNDKRAFREMTNRLKHLRVSPNFLHQSNGGNPDNPMRRLTRLDVETLLRQLDEAEDLLEAVGRWADTTEHVDCANEVIDILNGDVK